MAAWSTSRGVAWLIAGAVVLAAVSLVPLWGPSLVKFVTQRALIAHGGQEVYRATDPKMQFVSKVTVAVLVAREGTVDVCTGVIVGPISILTSARCVEKAAKTDVLFVDQIADSDVAAFAESQKTGVQEIKYHPRYRRDADGYDFALLKISSPIPADRQPVDYDRAFVITEGDPVSIAGFPSLAEAPSGSQPAIEPASRTSLRYAVAPVSGDVHSWMVRDGAGSCWYDTGGPVFRMARSRPLLLGIHRDGGCSTVSYFSTVSDGSVRRWLQQEVQ